jgi:hypothetical protein
VGNRTAAQMLGIGRVVEALQLPGLCPWKKEVLDAKKAGFPPPFCFFRKSGC